MLVEGFVLCNDAVSDENGIIGDPTEVALIELGKKFNILKQDVNVEHPRVNEMPFDSERKMMSTQHVYGDVKISFTKGAVDNILPRCKKIYDGGKTRNITKEDLAKLEEATHSMSLEALRVLALGYKEDGEFNEENLIFVGLVGMIDPPRPEAK